MTTATIARGSVLSFRMLDVADELDLDRLARTLGRDREVRRVALPNESALALAALPVEIDAGARRVVLGPEIELDVAAQVRVFRFGVVSVMLEWTIPPGTPLSVLVPIAAAVWESTELDRVAREVYSGVTTQVREACDEPLYDSAFVERYSIVFAQELSGDPFADPQTLARILLGDADPRPLSTATIDDALRHRFGYYADELVIPHTSSALVIEPGGSRDNVLALELAASQLLELRTYDAMIDEQLDGVYRELARARSAGWWLFGRRHRALSRHAQEQMLELAELADRAENAVKVTSDLALARVYVGAIERLQVPSWRRSVSRKLELFAQVYDVLKEEADAQRSTVLEATIVVLIVLEIVMALLGK